MGFLNPLALLFGLLALPIVLLYMLRLRRRKQVVSSTLVWRELTRDRHANAPWRRPRPNLLMFLQLAALAALVLALARPFVRLPGQLRGNTIVLLDTSASMLANDGDDQGRTRFDVARDELERSIGRLSGDDRLTLIAVDAQPTALIAASADRSLLRQALGQARAELVAADWPAAFALAAGAAQGLADPRFLILSDGNLPDDLPPLPGPVALKTVGQSGENLAISALAPRESPGGPELLASVVNEGTTAKTAVLSVSLDGRLYDARRLTLPAGGRSDQTWSLPAETSTIAAELVPENGAVDHLPADNQAWAVRAAGGSQQVLLASAGNLFLEQALGLLPGVDLQRTTAEGLSGEAAADWFVLDGAPVPATLPDGPLLLVNPQPGETGAPIQVGAVFTPTGVTRQLEHPILQFVDWEGIDVREARSVSGAGLEPLVETDAGPLLLSGEVEGHRIVVLPFDLRESDLPLQIAFPVVTANIANWFGPGRAVASQSGMEPGTPINVTLSPDTATVEITRPDGLLWREAVGPEMRSLLYGETELPGIYQVALVSADGTKTPGGSVAISFANPAESRIAPRPDTRLSADGTAAEPVAVESRRELWPWLVAIGFGLLMTEWWLSHPSPLGRPRVKLQ
jgi:hypothetical protein